MNDSRLIERRCNCSCGAAFFFRQLVVGEPKADEALAVQTHYHPYNALSGTTNVMTLYGDGSISQQEQEQPKRIYVKVICPDDCDCHDRWGDES